MLSSTPAPYGFAVINFQVLEFMEPVRRAIEATAFAAADKRLIVRVLNDRKHTQVRGNSVRLEQVFVNLLGNAIRFTPTRGAILINLAVSLNAAEVTVTDTGIGIAPDALDEIFDSFAQTVEWGDAKRGAAGSGLAISREIVQLHGGLLTAWSGGIGSGSSFSVRLPLATASRPLSVTFSGSGGFRTVLGPASTYSRARARSTGH
jgi:signal transduction histidine kinase